MHIPMIPLPELVKQRFGLTVRNLNAQELSAIGAKPGECAIIQQVEKNGPADKAKLQPGFLLTAVEDRKAGDLLRSVEMVASKRAGDRMRFAVIVPRSFGAIAGEHTATLTVR
jgi:S1-C subfamily serine protease